MGSGFKGEVWVTVGQASVSERLPATALDAASPRPFSNRGQELPVSCWQEGYRRAVPSCFKRLCVDWPFGMTFLGSASSWDVKYDP